ncbi:hypothetical protein B0H11DRAFT_2135309 [Mycena galericulata]|nr:hypothetical protein B0H11DRAFT_2135309 [Mycena galericulata]
MELPQELIDSIVDAIVADMDLVQDPWMIDNTADVLETLRACALVAHTFLLPCQMYIFHGISFSDEVQVSPNRFSALVGVRPHLASYVRAIYFEYTGAAEEPIDSITHILASVHSLARLDIARTHDGAASFLSTFSLPNLRHLTLWYFQCEDASELQNLLSTLTGLKTLTLRSITFEATGPAKLASPTPTSPQIVLDSLNLYFLDATQVQAILNAFTAIDITKLRSLYLHNTPMNSLLRANAASIQHVKILTYSYYPDAFRDETIEQGMLAGAHRLRSLDLRVPYLSSLNKMVQLFGVSDLTSLQTISVKVSQRTNSGEWQSLDGLLGLLGDLPALRLMHVYSAVPHPEDFLRNWMPALSERDVLRIHDSPPDV